LRPNERGLIFTHREKDKTCPVFLQKDAGRDQQKERQEEACGGWGILE
jgi:hypothetical protein